jgi:hypothetical protein
MQELFELLDYLEELPKKVLPQKQKKHGDLIKDLTRRKASERAWKLHGARMKKAVVRSAKTPAKRRMYRHLGRFNSLARNRSSEGLEENMESVSGRILNMLEDLNQQE